MKTNNVLNRATKGILSVIAVGTFALFSYTNCSKNSGSGSSSSAVNAATGTSTAAQTASFGLKVVNSSNNSVIYDDSNTSATLSLSSGGNYSFNIACSNVPAGSTLKLTATNTSTIAGVTSVPITVPVQCGSNAVSSNVFPQGKYALKLQATLPVTTKGQAAPVVAKSYNASVTCNPADQFVASAVSPANLTVTPSKGTSIGYGNLYDYNASSVIANAANFNCALDFTGTGIIDTVSQPCNQVFSSQYSNAVGVRSVSLIVQNSCNTYQFTTSLNNAFDPLYTNPSWPAAAAAGSSPVSSLVPGSFIYAQTSAAAGSAKGDARVDNMTYLATLNGNQNAVVPTFDSGIFTIQSTMQYSQSTSQQFGMNLTISGIKGDTSKVQNFDFSSAQMSAISFSADENPSASPAQPAVTFSGSNCTLSHMGGGTLQSSVGAICAGTSGPSAKYDSANYSVEVWGHYSCTNVSDTGGSVTIEGNFDGTWSGGYQCGCGCGGGGGGGGGGSSPVGV
jgi:hypothetical protein